MQVIILCGGHGTRIRDVSENVVPKPMIPVGERPIVWHIMKHYASYGHTDFVLCLGHLGWKLKEYFLNKHAIEADVTVTTGVAPTVEYHGGPAGDEGWRVTLAETGAETGTAGRVKGVQKYITGDRYMLTYGDGVSDVDLEALEQFHLSHGQALTLTGVIPPGRFGELTLDGDRVIRMREKPTDAGRYVNGGFMVLERKFADKYLSNIHESMMLERAPFEATAEGGDMLMYKHRGFWQCMDTRRDWEHLNQLWKSNRAPWKVW